jgi:hypothetical protein
MMDGTNPFRRIAALLAVACLLIYAQPVSAQVRGKTCDVIGVTTSTGLRCNKVGKKKVWVTSKGPTPTTSVARQPLADACTFLTPDERTQLATVLGTARSKTFSTTSTIPNVNSADLRDCKVSGDETPLVWIAFSRVGIGKSFLDGFADSNYLPIENGNGNYYQLGPLMTMYLEARNIRLFISAAFSWSTVMSRHPRTKNLIQSHTSAWLW